MRPCGRPSAPAGCALGRRMTRLRGGRGSDRDGYRPGIRLAGLVALILALMAPLPASAAQDALPNLDAVVLAPADLSGGFIVSTDWRISAGVSFSSVGDQASQPTFTFG